MSSQSSDSEDYMPELPASLKKDTNCDDRDNKGDLSPKKSTKLSRSPGDRAADTEVYDERCQIGQKRRKLGADPSKGDAQSPTREEWMSLPTKQLEEMFGSDTSKAKHQKIQDLSAKNTPKVTAGPPNPYSHGNEEEIVQAIEEYNATYRPRSLMEIHRENVRQGKTPTTNSRKRAKDPYSSSGNSSSFWERHSDLANPAMNPQRRGDIIKRLSTASNNFTTGARRFH